MRESRAREKETELEMSTFDRWFANAHMHIKALGADNIVCTWPRLETSQITTTQNPIVALSLRGGGTQIVVRFKRPCARNINFTVKFRNANGIDQGFSRAVQ